MIRLMRIALGKNRVRGLLIGIGVPALVMILGGCSAHKAVSNSAAAAPSISTVSKPSPNQSKLATEMIQQYQNERDNRGN